MIFLKNKGRKNKGGKEKEEQKSIVMFERCSLLRRHAILHQKNINTPKATTMKFQIASDIHLEFQGVDAPAIIPKSDALFLAGDIGKPTKANLAQFLIKMASIFPNVYYVAGNHEFYGAEYWSTKHALKEICSNIPNLHFMDQDSIVWKGKNDERVRIIGCTLWSHVPDDEKQDVGRMLNDYHLIRYDESLRYQTNTSSNPPVSAFNRRLIVDDTNAMHQSDVGYLEQELTKSRNQGEDKVIVLTHHAPLANGVSDPMYEDGNSPIASAFQTPLDHLMGHNLKYWIYGHTHYNGDKTVNGTRVVANQAGYRHEKVRWDPNTVFEI